MDTLFASPLKDRYELVRVATHRDTGRLGKMAQAVTGTLQSGSSIVRCRADLVYLHASSGSSLLRKASVAALARVTRRPYILHIHAGDFDQYLESAPRWERWLARKTLRDAAIVVTLSPWWGRRIAQLAGCQTAVIPNPVSVPETPASLDSVPAQILSLGRLGEEKGSLTLVRALAMLEEPFADVRLVLAGDGDSRSIRAEARRLGVIERVELPGWIGADERARRLRSANLFALPSRREGLPTALLEAMAFGLPSIVTPVGGVPDVFREGRHGYFVPPDDPSALAERIARVLRDPDGARRMGTQARSDATRDFSVEVVAGLVAQAIESALPSQT